ncbi:MAG: DUF523 domain-containing protein [Siculibacillus sp.]|nr:DUF523 domain-containing protein [Siculibacillus sp.]
MERILVSACLIGWPVRWDGGAGTTHHPLLSEWAAEGRLVPFCPETAGGLPVPRPAAEIEAGTTAAAVLAGEGRILDAEDGDHTAAFREGARVALATARVRGCRFALLTEGSPSCGVDLVADGTFSGRRRTGEGVTTAALRAAGVEVFSPADIEALAARLAAHPPAGDRDD